MLTWNLIPLQLGLRSFCEAFCFLPVENIFRVLITLGRLMSYSYQPHLFRSAREVAELDDFLAAKKGAAFVFRDEVLGYCRSDTLVLCLATLKLEEATLRESGYKLSFIASSSCTIASLSTLYYRSCFMPADSIGVLPLSGLQSRNKTSALADAYFQHLNRSRKSLGLEDIRYSQSLGGEYCWKRMSVDGITSKRCYEVAGCMYHSCVCTFPKSSSRHPLYQIPNGQVRKLDGIRAFRFQKRFPGIKSHGNHFDAGFRLL